MFLLAASLILGVFLAQPAAASGRGQRDLELEVVCLGALPFSEDQLRQALLVRARHLGDVASVRVRGEEGRTSVQVGAIEREVDLAGRQGEEAARVVAVMALDLAQAGTPFPVPRPEAAAVVAAPPPAASRSPESRPGFRAGALLLGPFDQSGLVAHLEPTFDAGWEVVAGAGAFVTAGYRQAKSTDVGRSLVLHELPVRAGVALRRRWLELRAGGIARPQFVQGPRSYRTASFGGTISVAARLALTSRVLLVLTGGLDVFRTRTVFAVGDQASLTTPWLYPWVGAGLTWGAAR